MKNSLRAVADQDVLEVLEESVSRVMIEIAKEAVG